MRRLLEELRLPVFLNPQLVRGLDYYTKTVFEIWPPQIGAQAALGGGGRYDGLMEQLGGRPTPGIGFAAGIERIILNLKEQGIQVPEVGKPYLYVAYHGEQARIAALRLGDEARRKGIGCVTTLGPRSLKAQLKQADSLGARYAFILGEQEVAQGTVTVRDLVESKQWQEPVEDALEKISDTKG